MAPTRTNSSEGRALLGGLTVLDLASVGPAARCTRILADYGADVVKVGPVSKKAGKQIRPPFFSYGAGRGLRRAQIDLKAPEGREALLAIAAPADVVGESFRPGDRIDIRATQDARLMLVGGETIDGPRYIWWNFVSSSKERIEQAKADWKAQRYERVPDDDEFIPLPER